MEMRGEDQHEWGQRDMKEGGLRESGREQILFVIGIKRLTSGGGPLGTQKVLWKRKERVSGIGGGKGAVGYRRGEGRMGRAVLCFFKWGNDPTFSM